MLKRIIKAIYLRQLATLSLVVKLSKANFRPNPLNEIFYVNIPWVEFGISECIA